MVERAPNRQIRVTPSEHRIEPVRNFFEVAGDTRNSGRRAALMQPGDYLDMTVAELTAWYQPVPFFTKDQIAAGLGGATRVTLLEITRDEENRIKNVIVASDRDPEGTQRPPVDASLFYNYGTYGRWERH